MEVLIKKLSFINRWYLTCLAMFFLACYCSFKNITFLYEIYIEADISAYTFFMLLFSKWFYLWYPSFGLALLSLVNLILVMKFGSLREALKQIKEEIENV